MHKHVTMFLIIYASVLVTESLLAGFFLIYSARSLPITEHVINETYAWLMWTAAADALFIGVGIALIARMRRIRFDTRRIVALSMAMTGIMHLFYRSGDFYFPYAGVAGVLLQRGLVAFLVGLASVHSVGWFRRSISKDLS